MTNIMKEREEHPLNKFDPEATKYSDVVKLSYFEDPSTRAPVPRNQKIPSGAFDTLTGRSILVSTSHAWFHQLHPDPQGIKLKMIKEDFAPRLRKRYPKTHIVVFDDWHSNPQVPRKSVKEENRFRKAMDHMNSFYIYCDVVIFLEVPLPDLDDTVYKCTLNPSEHNWSFFIDVVQFQTKNSNLLIQKNDIVVAINDSPVDFKRLKSLEEKNRYVRTPSRNSSSIHGNDDTAILKKKKNREEDEEVVVVSFLKRPYGRPNRIPSEQRGWLFAERITVAIRSAASPASQFEDVVISNSDDVRKKIYEWSVKMRESARKEKSKPGSISKTLEHFKTILHQKRFSHYNDEIVVIKIMDKLVEKFRLNWNEESKRQSSMAKRAYEILLRWGEFTELYVERAGFLDDSRHRHDLCMTLLKGMIIWFSPLLAVLPYIFDITKDPFTEVWKTSIWNGAVFTLCAYLLVLSHYYELAGITLGSHSVFLCLYLLIVYTTESFVYRKILNIPVLPLECFVMAIIAILIIHPIALDYKYIRTTDSRTGKPMVTDLRRFLFLPKMKRFSDKALKDISRVKSLTNLEFVFAFMYPILAGVFFHAGTIVQALLVLVFFGVRATFEFAADALTSVHFGSDAMVTLCFGGVLTHEICLSIMLSNIKHPIVFAVLVLADVCENIYCLWSLVRIGVKNRVHPISSDDTDIIQPQNRQHLTKRTSSVYAMIQELKKSKTLQGRRKGASLYIATTLIQRELVELLVPTQAIGVISVLYVVDVKANSLTSSWENSVKDYHNTLMYLGIDFSIELFVFVCTILTLRHIFPEVDAYQILRGLIKMHFYTMLCVVIIVWMAILMFQSANAGMDMTFRFEWLACNTDQVHNHSASVWLGGFDWDC